MIPYSLKLPAPSAARLVGALVGLATFATGGCHSEYDASVTAWHRNATSLTHALPSSEAERLALERAPNVPPARTVAVIADSTVTFGERYASASGRTCRALRIEAAASVGTAHERLLCLDGEAWVLVPDLLEDGTTDGPEDEL